MAKRDKLNRQQQRRIKQKLEQKQHSLVQDKTTNGWSGLVVTRYGQSADVLDPITGQVHRCHLRQHLGNPVSGDQVVVSTLDTGEQVVESLLERKSLLTRPGIHKGIKPVAANIELALILVAPLPDFSATLLDRYLVAVENACLKAHIVLNKCDLAEEIKSQGIREQLRHYAQLGYPVSEISSHQGTGCEALRQTLSQYNSILVGQSGVGKSSLINRLFPGQQLPTKDVAQHSRLGQHTTTRSQLFLHDDKKHFVIDSPGVREFGLWHLDETQIFNGFIEFRQYQGQCRFRDCKHLGEKGCALLRAVEAGEINPSRLTNYQKIIRSLSDGK